MQEKADKSTLDKALPPKEADSPGSIEAKAVLAEDTDTLKAMVRNLNKI